MVTPLVNELLLLFCICKLNTTMKVYSNLYLNKCQSLCEFNFNSLVKFTKSNEHCYSIIIQAIVNCQRSFSLLQIPVEVNQMIGNHTCVCMCAHAHTTTLSDQN